MGKLQKDITLLSLTIEPGTTERVVCPACGGGSTAERSLAITKDELGVVLYKCHRASCGASGRVGGKGGVPSPKKQRVRPYTGPMRVLEDVEFRFLEKKFGLPRTDLPYIRYSESLNRFMLPIMSPAFDVRGWVARSFTETPKVLTFIHRDEPTMGWLYPRGGHKSPTIIVEDYFSACKVAMAGYTAVALNGVHIPPDGALELRGMDTLVMALDKGTMSQMLNLKARYGHLWKKVIIWKLDEDLKYESVERIRDAVENGKTSFERGDQGTGSLRRNLFEAIF